MFFIQISVNIYIFLKIYLKLKLIYLKLNIKYSQDNVSQDG